MNDADVLRGCRVLVVEDDALLSMQLQDMLNDMGCKVAGSATRFDDAMDKCHTVAFDAVLLDINLHGEWTISMAKGLRERDVAFVITTGYGERILPDSLRDAIVLQKPYQRTDLERALRSALHG